MERESAVDFELGGVSFHEEVVGTAHEPQVLRPVEVPKDFRTADGFLDAEQWVEQSLEAVIGLVCGQGQRLRLMGAELPTAPSSLPPDKNIDWHTDGSIHYHTLVALNNDAFPSSRGSTLFADVCGVWTVISAPAFLEDLREVSKQMRGRTSVIKPFVSSLKGAFEPETAVPYILRALEYVIHDEKENMTLVAEARRLLHLIETDPRSHRVETQWSTFDTHVTELFDGKHLHRAEGVVPEKMTHAYLRRATFFQKPDFRD